MKKTITPLYLHRRKDLTKDDLLEIYHNLNQFIWDDRLGEMPQEYHASRADEYRISCAVMMEIEWLVSKREARMYKYRKLVPSFTEKDMEARYTGILEAELPRSLEKRLSDDSYYLLRLEDDKKHSEGTPSGTFGS